MTVRPVKVRFMENISPEPNTGCWLWTASTGSHGYGQIFDNGRLLLAHRLSWEMSNGPIPVGLFVCHKCDVRECVNPGHLFLGTHSANMEDRCAKGRTAHGDGHCRAILTGKQAARIRQEYATGAVTQRELGDKYGVTRTCVSAIVRNRSWKHVK